MAPNTSALNSNVSPSIRNLVIELSENYWRSKCTGERLPTRSEIDPLDIPALLPQIILLDVRRDPWDFRFRLIGTNMVHHLSNDWTGSWMSEIKLMAPPSRIFTSCVKVATFGKPLRSDTPYVGPYQNFVRAEDVILPLTGDGVTPDILLVFVEHFSKG